jgi:hypothetical protein
MLNRFYLQHQLLPSALMLFMLLQNRLLIVADQIVCQVRAEIVEASRIGGNLLDIVALIVDVDLLDPAFGLHRCLYHLEDSADIGDVFYQGFHLFDLGTVLIEEFVDFVHQIRPVFLHYHVLEIFKFYSFVFDFVQIFGSNIVLLHFRRQIVEV